MKTTWQIEKSATTTLHRDRWTLQSHIDGAPAGWLATIETASCRDDGERAETEKVLALVAAAPELLSALNAMLTHMGMDEDEYNKATFDQARAAINKATGKKE